MDVDQPQAGPSTAAVASSMMVPSLAPLPKIPLKKAAVPVPSEAAKFRKRTSRIREGDLVIIFLSRDRPTLPLRVVKGQTYINTFGSFPHDAMIGLPFGSTIRAVNGRGHMILLRPTPELWTMSLPHRTQILYAPDMSFIAMKLGLSPGARVAEAGTGSGSFTHFLARCVATDGVTGAKTMGKGWSGAEGDTGGSRGRQTRPPREDKEADGSEAATPELAASSSDVKPLTIPPFSDNSPLLKPEGMSQAEWTSSLVNLARSQASATPDDESAGPSSSETAANGRLWSFEFHRARYLSALAEFKLHHLIPSPLSLSHRNVCLHGFPPSLDGLVDAVFLDLPAPWEVIPFLPSTLSKSHTTRICCFSPCIEQVLTTVKALWSYGFKDVETYESLIRTHESLKSRDDSVAGMKSIGEVMKRLKDNERKRERVSEIQRSKAREKRRKVAEDGELATAAASAPGQVDEAEEEEDDDNEEEEGDGQDDQEDDNDDRKVDGEIAQEEVEDATISTSEPRKIDIAPPTSSTANPSQQQQQQQQPAPIVISRIHPTMRGHTSYLTFASLLPR